jgi:hypothetical protein
VTADAVEVEVVLAHTERATLRVGDVFLKIDSDQTRTDVEVAAMAMACPFDLAILTLAHEKNLGDVRAGYGTDVDRDLIRAWWSWRCLVVVRWLFEHALRPDRRSASPSGNGVPPTQTGPLAGRVRRRWIVWSFCSSHTDLIFRKLGRPVLELERRIGQAWPSSSIRRELCGGSLFLWLRRRHRLSWWR